MSVGAKIFVPFVLYIDPQTCFVSLGTYKYLIWYKVKSDSKNNLQFQHRNTPAFSIQDSPTHSERTLVHKQP
jgi:hypothetical protein